ncbi:hypothetical protein Clacol_008108 [Clathrus columnatus]|uniref:Uncharacterized protein n=1 Tax=Clathrus columnatus TaxID=1419009 RepID=A0AAV5AN53_9AGAM|nr:hypothetical protein Clacol_008108 [Clathrus columnatus]
MENDGNEPILAIAICVLRNKPRDQSLASYIIDLKEKFPISQTTNTSTSTAAGYTEAQTQWRKRALELEEENETLKFRLQKYEIESLASKLTLQSPQVDNAFSRTSKKTKAGNNPNTLRSLLDDLVAGPGLPRLQDSFDILSSFHTLKKASDKQDIGSEFNTETVLIPNVKRSLRALSKLLEALLGKESDGSNIAKSAKINVAERLQELLVSLLRSTFSMAPRHKVLSDIMEELCIGIVRPVIQGFHLVSIEVSKISKNNKNSEVDIRPGLLRMILRLLNCLHSMKEKTRELREFMVVETAREIESLWKRTGDMRDPAGILDDTRQRMARKDSLWYHCAIINIALDGLPEESTQENGKYHDRIKNPSVLSVFAVDILYDLPRLFEQESPVDVMAQSMILAIVEKAWLGGLCVCEREGDDHEAKDHSTVHDSSESSLH